MYMYPMYIIWQYTRLHVSVTRLGISRIQLQHSGLGVGRTGT